MIDVGIKELYNRDNHIQASKWVREELKDKKNTEIMPHVSSYITVVDADNQKCVKGFLGCYVGLGNNLYQSNSGVAMYSTIAKYGNSNVSLSVLPENFNKVCALFTARKAVAQDWMNDKDEYFGVDYD